MRQLFVAAIMVSLAFGVSLARADKVEIKGPHLCCAQCVKIAGATLAKVEGVSDAKCDTKAKTITFTAKDTKTAESAVKAIIDSGFFGTATSDGKELKVDAGTAKKQQADEVTVKAVHVCCGQCQTAIKALFKDGKITFEGAGPQKDVKISGKALDKAAVLEALRKSGFNGKVE